MIPCEQIIYDIEGKRQYLSSTKMQFRGSTSRRCETSLNISGAGFRFPGFKQSNQSGFLRALYDTTEIIKKGMI